MCGRFAIAITVGFHDRFDVRGSSVEVIPRFNIAPTQEVPVVISESPRRLVTMRWGLIPRWAKDEKIGSRLINARAETLSERPAFRSALQSRRCLVPATGFFEWKKVATRRIPHYVRLRDHTLFAFAGLYDRWKNPAGSEVPTFTIITTPPNRIVAPLHDRMPAVLRRVDEAAWIRKEPLSVTECQQILTPIDGALMEAYAVSPAVNSPTSDSEDLVRPLNAE